MLSSHIPRQPQDLRPVRVGAFQKSLPLRAFQHMTKTYTDLMKQIETLREEAERVRRDEVAGVVARIKEAIAVYGLTAADLGLSPAARGGRPAKAPATPARRGAAKAKGRGKAAGPAAKYRDEQGRTWGGRGPRPLWLREALNAGRKLEDFAV